MRSEAIGGNLFPKRYGTVNDDARLAGLRSDAHLADIR